MKVLLINGSPHAKGCTFTALSEIAATLAKQRIATEIFQLGTKPVRGCIACGKCHELQQCIFTDDIANELLEKARAADAMVIGSPIYFAGPNGALCAVLDRMFFSSGTSLQYKPAAAIVSGRRGGASATFDRLNKYFTIKQMPIVSAQYWNTVHGMTPDEVRKDEEGLQTMRALANNMAWMLKTIAQAKLALPEQEPKIMTNFIKK